MHYKDNAVPWLSRLVAGLSPRKPGFDPSSAHVKLVVDKVALEHIFIRALRFSLVSFIPPLLHTHLRLHAAFTRSTNRRHQGNFQKAMLFRKSGSVGQKDTFAFIFLVVSCPPLTAEARLPIPGQELWWLASFHECATPIFILTPLLSKKDKWAKPGNLQTKECSFVYRTAKGTEVLYLLTYLLPPWSSPS